MFFPLTNSIIFQDGHIAPPTRCVKIISASEFQESPGISGHFWEAFFERIRSGDLLDRSPVMRSGRTTIPSWQILEGWVERLNSLWRWARLPLFLHKSWGFWPFQQRFYHLLSRYDQSQKEPKEIQSFQ